MSEALGVTEVDEVYRRLRGDIVSGRRAPGSALNAAALSAHYASSSGTVRQALPRLAGEGLVVVEPERGYRVATASVEDLRQLTEARVLVETHTLRLSIEHGGPAFAAGLVAAHEALARTAPFGADGRLRPEWRAAHEAFHRALGAGSPNRRLAAIASALRDATKVSPCWAGALGHDRQHEAFAEHRGILDAALARDADRAVDILGAHIRHSAELLIRAASGGAPMDPDSTTWVRTLRAAGREQQEAERRLHGMLLRAARSEMSRRAPRTRLAGPEADDLAFQAAADAMVAVLAKLEHFRGESRFTTWAYRFVILEVSTKIGRHFWRHPSVPLDGEDWDRLPDRFGLAPEDHLQWRATVDALRDAVEQDLTPKQRRVFCALVLRGVPLDALVAELGTNRNAIYKTMFDARRKLRAALAANGLLDRDSSGPS